MGTTPKPESTVKIFTLFRISERGGIYNGDRKLPADTPHR